MTFKGFIFNNKADMKAIHDKFYNWIKENKPAKIGNAKRLLSFRKGLDGRFLVIVTKQNRYYKLVKHLITAGDLTKYTTVESTDENWFNQDE